MHGVRINPGDHGKCAGHHQALDMVGISLAPGLVDRGGEAGHVGLAGPVEFGQGACRLQGVAADIVRSFAPIDAAHIFAPADDLADEAFGRVQRRPAGAPGRFDTMTDGKRVEQADIDVGRQQRVIEEGFAGQHGVLVVAEIGEGGVDEMIQRRLGPDPRHGEAKRLDIAEPVRKA